MVFWGCFAFCVRVVWFHSKMHLCTMILWRNESLVSCRNNMLYCKTVKEQIQVGTERAHFCYLQGHRQSVGHRYPALREGKNAICPKPPHIFSFALVMVWRGRVYTCLSYLQTGRPHILEILGPRSDLTKMLAKNLVNCRQWKYAGGSSSSRCFVSFYLPCLTPARAIFPKKIKVSRLFLTLFRWPNSRKMSMPWRINFNHNPYVCRWGRWTTTHTADQSA